MAKIPHIPFQKTTVSFYTFCYNIGRKAKSSKESGVFMNYEKVICPCYKVTKGDIVHAVENGATSFKEVKKATKVGKGCGKCKKKAKKLTKKLLKELS